MNFRLLLSSLLGVVTFRKTHRHINFALIDQGLASGLNFFTLVALARLLGPGEFGAYSVAWSIVMLAKPVQGALIVGPLQSIGAKQPAAARPSYFLSVGLQQAALAVLLASAAVAGSWIYTRVADLSLHSLLLPLFCAVLADQFHDFFRRFFFVMGRGERACVLNLLVGVSRVLTLLLVAWRLQPLGAGPTLLAVAASSLLVAPLAAFAAGPMRAEAQAWRSTLKRHWAFGKWVLPYTFGTAMIGTTIPLVAGSQFGVELVGGLRASFNVVAPGFVIILALFSIIPISASRVLEASGRRELRQYLARVTVAVTAVSVVIALGASFFAKELLVLLYGESYAHFAEIVRWHSAAMVVMGLQLPIESGIRALEKTQVLTNAVLLQGLTIGLVLLILPSELGVLAIMVAVLLDRLAPVTYLSLWLWRELQQDEVAAARS